MCAQCQQKLVVRASLLPAQLTNLLTGSFCYQRACRHRSRLPALTVFFSLLVEGKGRVYIPGIHLRETLR